MKTLLITSGITFLASLVGCSITEDQEFKNELCIFGLMCLFTLMYAAHLAGTNKQNRK
jgi:hypothetical protein